MTSYAKTAKLPRESQTTTQARRRQAEGRYALVRYVFARNGVEESVTTRVHFYASPEAIWDRIMFYEEIPGRPPFLLRTFLPHPVRSEGDKTGVGAAVECTYDKGDLVKRITAVEPPYLVQFEVAEQRLGIEGCVLALSGSCEIRCCGDGSDVLLTTNYRAYLRPRFLWRPLEKYLAGQLHRHILNGMRAALPHCVAAPRRTAAECAIGESAPRGALACIVSHSHSHR